MKVYRGYNKEVGPISYPNWIYVTADPEQAKYYATKDGFVKDGAIIEYDMDKEHMSWISLSKINSMAENDNEYYSEEDLLWYQEELAYSLRGLRDGIVFVDPYNKDHTIYIVLDKSLLQNGRVLSQEEFDAIQLKESSYDNEINKALANAGILNEKVITVNAELADTQLVTSPYELNEIIENHPEKRIIYDMEHNWFLVGNSETSIHIHLVNDALQDGIYAPFEYNGELIDGSQEDDGDTYCDLHRDELVLFVTSANTEKNVHYLEDNYYYTYVYKDYVVYDRKFDFRFTPLYKILGEPLSITYWDGFNKKDMKSNKTETINESVIRKDDNEICGYYTSSSKELLNIIDNIYKENDIRVLYDIDRNLYIFADTYSAIHFNLMLYMILFTNVYDNIPEIKNNKYESDEVLQDIIKSKLYFSSFKIFRNYTNDSDEEFIRFLENTPENSTDGYAYGYACKINDKLWAICRDDEIGEAKQVPLLQNKTWINLNDNNY